MEEILENVLTERILLIDFKEWLISDSIENVTEKTNFIPYFLNFIKEECAWLISKDIKSFESPSKQLHTKPNDSKDKSVSVSGKKSVKSPVKSTSKKENYENNRIVENFHNKQHKFQEGTKAKPHSFREEFMFKEQSKIANTEKNRQKSNFSAKRSLNSFDNTKTPVSTGQMFECNIKSLEAFPPLGQKSCESRHHDSKARRRITPTPVEVLNKGSSKFRPSKFAMPAEKVPNEVFKSTPCIETDSSDLQSERELLKITRNKLSQSIVPSNNFNDMKMENVAPIKCNVTHYVFPDPEKVSHKKQLQVLSSIYSILLTNALVPNVTSELYFIFELLTSNAPSEKKCKDKNNVFSTIHNCVFFGVTVLNELQYILNLLDKSTIISLCEISFLSNFSPQLVNFLNAFYEEKQEVATTSLSVNRVPFLLEEDSKENFIDAHSFVCFRKQRDLFYELLRDWQQQPLDIIDIKFQENFSRKVKILISLGPNAVNMYHLARLFQNQLIASCHGLEVNEVYDDLLIDIQKNFPGKFEKLRQRFMTPFCVGEPNPPPTFYGIQAFFSELIQSASSATFNQYLQDIFVSKILDFNSSDMLSDGELGSISIIKEKYTFLLHTLRLLGKFLGYIFFFPYKVPEPVPLSIIHNQLNIRKNSAPPLDVLKLLKLAIENNRIILTVPWIVEYLSMIDPVGPKLPYIEETLKILVAIYRGKYISTLNSLHFWFLRIIIGWLFDVLHFPSTYCSLLQPITFHKNLKSEGLDVLDIIDKQLVHSCCPYLIEFKVLICNYVNGIKKNSKREIRKITPLSMTKQHVTTSITSQQIEIQLEENFFFLHPPSLKKTVEFIAERMTSRVIGKIRSEVTEFKLHSVKYITDQEQYKALINAKPENINKLMSYIDSCILELYEQSQSKIADFIHVSCQKDIENVMPYLLSDVKSPILKMCCKISFRLAVNKIVDWCDTNLILANIKKDIKNKLTHLSKGEGNTAKETNVCISSIIASLRNEIVSIHSAVNNIKINYNQILSEVSSLVNKNIGKSTKTLLISLTVDLYIALIIYYPEKYNEFNEYFINVWSLCQKNIEFHYLSIQNIKFLLAAKDFEISCDKYTLMLSLLVNNGLCHLDTLQGYLTKLNSFQWKDSRCFSILSLVSKTLETATK